MGERMDPVEAVSEVLRRTIADVFGPEAGDVNPQVRRSDHADLQADVALGLARKLRKAPKSVAESIAAALPKDSVVGRAEVAGPGFLNITLSADWLTEAAAYAMNDPRCGVALGKAERIVVDYSSPNVAKEMHVGHLRSTVIGDALARVFEWRGHTVIRQNHIGDWGTPFGMLIEHLTDLGAGAAANALAVGELSEFYQAAREKFDKDPAFAERARGRVVLLQSGDESTLAHWRTLVELSKTYFELVYEKLGVTLTPGDIRGESFYNDVLGPLARDLEASGKATTSEGALCLFPPGFASKDGHPLPLIVRKSDGGFGYATTDLAAIRYRLQELRADRTIVVVGAPQTLHLAMVFAAAKELGWLRDTAQAVHVSFGSVLGTDKRMFKTRSGSAVRLIDLIDAAVEKAAEVIDQKAPDLDDGLRRELARSLGVGSIKYADLSSDRVKDYVFDIDRMVAFEGHTAGYAQYAHARACSIARKAADDHGVTAGAIRLSGEASERALLLEILNFGSVVAQVEQTLEPHRLCGYVFALATAFTRFYDHCPVLKAESAARASRLALTDLTARTLARAMSLLGIEAPSRM